MRQSIYCFTAGVALLFSSSGRLFAQDRATLYKDLCASCHDAGVERAPNREALRAMSPERVLAARRHEHLHLAILAFHAYAHARQHARVPALPGRYSFCTIDGGTCQVGLTVMDTIFSERSGEGMLGMPITMREDQICLPSCSTLSEKSASFTSMCAEPRSRRYQRQRSIFAITVSMRRSRVEWSLRPPDALARSSARAAFNF